MKRLLGLLVVSMCTAGALGVGATAPAAAPAAGVATAPAPAPAAAPAGGGKAAAVLIAGLGGSLDYSRNLADWTGRFAAVLTGQCGLAADNVVVLTEKADAKASPPRQESTRENFLAAMKRMASLLTEGDQFILFMVGHGQLNEPAGKLCLPGRDLDADELADLLGRLPTRRIVIVNGASGGAEFLKALADDGRVILTGAGAGSDGNQTYYPEFFLRGYETGEADLDGNKVIDLLEAYAYSARWTTNFYHRQYMGPEVPPPRRRGADDPGVTQQVWLVHGRQTRAIWQRLYAGSRHTMEIPERAKAGIKIPLPDPNGPDLEPQWGKWDVHWHKRRFLVEHARLDDNAGKQGFSLWEPYQFKPLPPDEPGQTGWLARRTVLGRPALREVAAPTTMPAAATAPAAATSAATGPR